MKLPVEGTRYEVIAGELYITPILPLSHQEVLASFLVKMFGWVKEHQLGRLLPVQSTCFSVTPTSSSLTSST